MASLKLILTRRRLERGSAMVVIGCKKTLIACRFNFSGFWQNQHRIAEGIKAIVRRSLPDTTPATAADLSKH